MLLDAAKEKYQISHDWTFICDFDNTITTLDVTDAMLARFADAEWEDIEQDWNQKKITARQCMQKQVALLDASRRDLDDFLDSVPIRDGFTDFVKFCERQSLRLLLVSDGLDYSIRRVLTRHGLARLPVFANRLLFDGPSSYRLEFPFGVKGCPSGVCKCAVAADAASPILLIGDGLSDCCVAKSATLTFALRGEKLERACLEKQYNYLPYTNFVDVRSTLATLLHQPVAPRQTRAVLAKSA